MSEAKQKPYVPSPPARKQSSTTTQQSKEKSQRQQKNGTYMLFDSVSNLAPVKQDPLNSQTKNSKN